MKYSDLMALLLFLLLFLSAIVLCTKGKTGNDGFLNALKFISKLRDCDIQSEHLKIKLPKLSSYATASTLNVIVDMVIESEYLRFWQKLRKWDYGQDKVRLDALSKGAALANLKIPTLHSNDGGVTGVSESSLLVPVLKGGLPRFRLKCIFTDADKLFESLAGRIERSKYYLGLEKQLVLSAVRMLDIAVQISKCSWTVVSEEEKSALRSNDRAIECIRVWDRNSTSLKILYLTFILHARQLIAHLSNNTEESMVVTSLQKDLERIVQTEFPLNIMKEVGWENVPRVLYFSNDEKVYQRSVSEVHLLFAKDGPKYVRNARNLIFKKAVKDVGNLFVERDKLYVSVGESVGNDYPGGWERFLDDTMRDVSKKDFVMSENPTTFYL